MPGDLEAEPAARSGASCARGPAVPGVPGTSSGGERSPSAGTSWQSLRSLPALFEDGDRWPFAALVLLMLVNAGVELLGIGLIPLFIGTALNPEAIDRMPALAEWMQRTGIELDRSTLLAWGSAMLLAVFTFKVALAVWLNHARMRFVQLRVQSLSLALFRGYVQAPYLFHASQNSSALIRNITGECTTLGMKVLTPAMDLLTNAVVAVAILAFLVIRLPAGLLVWVLAFIFVAALVVGVLQRRLREHGVTARTDRKRMIRVVQEALGGIKELKVSGRYGVFLEEFSGAIGRTMSIQRIVAVLNKTVPALMEWLTVVGLLGLTFLLLDRGMTDDALMSTLVLFAVALVRLKGVSGSIAGSLTLLRHNAVSVDVVRDELAAVRKMAEEERAVTAAVSRGRLSPARFGRDFRSLRLESISFTYPGSEMPALDAVDLEIEHGEFIGIVGATGSGKSTLIDVFLGLVPPDAGAVVVDGVDVRADIPTWQAGIGYVPQHIYLSDNTVRANIALGLPESTIDPAAVDAAVQAAHVHEFLDRLPAGLDTRVGERGIRLSGGQRQRIGIARALYGEPPLLILDEATSALDNATEKSVMAAIDALRGSRTIVAVAHRLSTVKHFDRILMLDKGKLLAVGSYDELLANCAPFEALVRAQAAGTAAGPARDEESQERKEPYAGDED